jgi:hypothetical protein
MHSPETETSPPDRKLDVPDPVVSDRNATMASLGVLPCPELICPLWPNATPYRMNSPMEAISILVDDALHIIRVRNASNEDLVSR